MKEEKPNKIQMYVVAKATSSLEQQIDQELQEKDKSIASLLSSGIKE